MRYSREEQETCIIWDEATKLAKVYSASPVVMRQLDKLAVAYPDCYQRVWSETDKASGKTMAAKYEVASKFVRFRKPPTKAQLEAGVRLAARMGFFGQNGQQ